MRFRLTADSLLGDCQRPRTPKAHRILSLEGKGRRPKAHRMLSLEGKGRRLEKNCWMRYRRGS
jgi:hypothetical protein